MLWPFINLSVQNRVLAPLHEALTGKAYAYRNAAILKNLELKKVIVETDSEELVSLWNSKANNRCTILPVLNQIQELCKRCTHFNLVLGKDARKYQTWLLTIQPSLLLSQILNVDVSYSKLFSPMYSTRLS